MLGEHLAQEADREVPAEEVKRFSQMDPRSLGRQALQAAADRRAQDHHWGSEGLLLMLGPLNRTGAGG